jgi:hypothetical protein
MGQQQVRVAHREQRRADAGRRLGKKRVGRGLHHIGQVHTAPLIGLRGGEQARLGVGPPGIVRGLRQDHFFTIEPGLYGVHQTVERCELLACDAFAGVEHLRKGFARMLSKAWALGERFNAEPVVQQKIDGVTHGSGLVALAQFHDRALRQSTALFSAAAHRKHGTAWAQGVESYADQY